jgi:hypothetical protein
VIKLLEVCFGGRNSVTTLIHAVIKLFKVSFGKQAIYDFLSQQNAGDAILPTRQFYKTSNRRFFTCPTLMMLTALFLYSKKKKKTWKELWDHS